jgi:hypothetical protein
MWADAMAIARIADGKKDMAAAVKFRDKAAKLKENMQKKLWDPKREFFFHMYMRDEQRDGHIVKALSLTHQTGQFAGSPHGRELIGYVPWQFNMLDAGYESAWKKLMDPQAFYAEFGPYTVEKHDPMFKLSPSCCWWSGQSWPYATAQTLKAMANLLQEDRSEEAAKNLPITKADYTKQLHIFAKSHRKNGIPYIAEALHPDTGSFNGHDSYGHSEHYFHSSYCDLVITGLAGLIPQDDEDSLVLRPLAPPEWDYFALDDVRYHGRNVSILWDKTGQRYGKGAGFHLLSDGREIASSPRLEELKAKLTPARENPPPLKLLNFAVNNDGSYFPRVWAAYTGPSTSISKLNDGNYEYHQRPPNRWTCEGSPNNSDSVTIGFGMPRQISQVKLYILDDVTDREKYHPSNDPADGKSLIQAPLSIDLEYHNGEAWAAVPDQKRSPALPEGHRANAIDFPALAATQLRVTLHHRPGMKSGLSEIEAWGHADSYTPPPSPKGNLAYNPGGQPFPKVSASYTCAVDRVEHVNDGVVNLNPNPHNRWTNYDSKNAEDWVAIDFGQPIEFTRVELAIYDDHGGVQAPKSYALQYWDGAAWRPVANARKSPAQPAGGQYNEVRFDKVRAAKLRVVFTNNGAARCGVSEIFVWP